MSLSGYILMSFVAGVKIDPVPDLDSCPEINLVENFNLQKFLGKWYEAENLHFPWDLPVKCSTANFTMTENGRVRLIESTYSSEVEGNSSVEHHVALIKMANEPKYEIRSMRGIYAWFPYPMFYGILGTDYDNYSVIWGCHNDGRISVFSTRIFTRQKHPEPAVIEDAYEILKKNGIYPAFMKSANKENCPEDY